MMRVIKRNGDIEDVSFDKVLNRIKHLSSDLRVNVVEIAQQVCSRIYDGVKTSELDELAAQMCSSMIVDHPDYGILAARIAISNHQKNTSPSFSETIQLLFDNLDVEGNSAPLVSEDLYNTVQRNKEKLNSYIDYSRDYLFDYFGFKTLERSYLMNVKGRVVERPQHMWMRVALGIHGNDFKDALQTYDLMSTKHFTHATPTLFNAGTPRPQCSSCYLQAIPSDSISSIYESLSDCAQISKYAGGIGLHVSNIRSKGSRIRGTNGVSTGIVPMLRVFNNTARYVNQSGRRLGSIAIYLEPWHADIHAFLDLRKNHGHEEDRCRDLFLALWVPDLFMERVRDNGVWSLMCPDACPGLTEVYGSKFKELYMSYESQGKYMSQVKAQDLWFKILESQIETGTPYILFKDAANEKSNQKNVGTIKSSNLCIEIIEYSSEDETAVCNLASIGLPQYVTDENSFDFEKLYKITKIITKNLNKIIDLNFYPIEKARRSNLRHRPIGIGVQGLADVFAKMRLPFESEEAKDLNKQIFETIYYAALEASMSIAKRRHETFMANNKNATNDEYLQFNEYDKASFESPYPGAYSTFSGSPASKGLLQFDMWGVDPLSNRYDWQRLKEDIKTYGLRNSLLVAPMPTASTAQILGNNESFEPFTSNLFKRKTLSGEFIVINKYLLEDLINLGLWNRDMKDQLVLHDGSIQHIEGIPDNLKSIYKTVWEIKQKHIIDMAADRGAFIDQSQSLNLFIEDPDYKKLTSMLFYAWSKGLKCGVYYLRTRPKSNTQKFTLDPTLARKQAEKNQATDRQIVCTDEVCMVCSS